MLRPSDVTAIVVTRGDHDLGEIGASLNEAGYRSIWVWDNSKQHNLAVWARWHAALLAPTDVVYVQDDDCLMDEHFALCVAHGARPGIPITANMPFSRWRDYPDSCLVGWGALIDKAAIKPALERWVERAPVDAAFRLECDIVLTTLIPHVKVDLGFRHLPWAETPDRMFRNPRPDRPRLQAMARSIRDAPLTPA